MAKNLCNAAGFSTLKNQTYDADSYTGRGFNTDIDWSKFTILDTENTILLYNDSDINISAHNAQSLVGTNGYLIMTTTNYLYSSVAIEESGLNIPANTWVKFPSGVEEVPEPFLVDPNYISEDYETQFYEVMSEELTVYNYISLEDTLGTYATLETLNNTVNSESSARGSADNELWNAIYEERNIRSNADNSLLPKTTPIGDLPVGTNNKRGTRELKEYIYKYNNDETYGIRSNSI